MIEIMRKWLKNLGRTLTIVEKYQTTLGWGNKQQNSVKLLGVTLDYKLNFDPHISDLCKKAAAQLNVLKRLRSFIGFAEKRSFGSKFRVFEFQLLSFSLVLFVFKIASKN